MEAGGAGVTGWHKNRQDCWVKCGWDAHAKFKLAAGTQNTHPFLRVANASRFLRG